MININKSSGQHGAALLFALGILSLLLVMGVAFLGNALISQKIAFNSQESATAKLLGRTAIDRVLSHLTMFHLIQARTLGDFYANDGSSVFSRMETNELTSPASPIINSLTTKRDLIYTENSPLLSISRGKENPDIPSERWYNGAKSLAEWIYVHQDGNFSDGNSGGTNIVGRFAYQVLPQTSNSRLSLYAVTAGASRRAGEKANAATGARIPQKHRLGLDVDELIIPNAMFSSYWKHDGVACDPLHDFDNFINILSGYKNSTGLPFYGDTRETEDRKRWLEHIFTEGRGRNAREAYSDGETPIPNWYPRFNLGRFNNGENWYERFIKGSETVDTVKNNSTIVDRLTRHPGVVINNLGGALSPKFQYVDGYLDDSRYDPFGLPFLRRIGNNSEKGAFDSVENLRKQIAANLNDYCDDDSIPTSDIDADKWIKDDEPTSTPPKYTGNEATPYINEIGFGFLIKNPKFNQGEKYTFSAEAQSEAWVELIKVYRNMIPKLIASYGFTGKITDLELVLKVTIGGKATFFEKVNEGGQEVEKAFLENQVFDDVSAESTGGVFAGNTAPPFDLSIKKEGFSGDGPYWLKNIQLDKTVSLNADFTDGIKKKAANGSVFVGKDISKIEVELSKIKIEISKVKFNLGNLVLYDASGSSKIGVDFVTVEKEGSPREVAPGITLCDGGKDEFNEAFAPNNAIIAFAGGMEAIDPRQNLNARSVQDKMNDWRNVDKPSFAYVPVKGETQHHFPVDNWKWDVPSTRVTGGSVNDSSKPNAPMYADGIFIAASDKDKETAEDPAWQGDAANQHISTAVIRNAPMRSPWELGFIHRGIPFQTINLKKAGGIIDGNDTLDEKAHNFANFADWINEAGTKYEHGDAGILDQIKMTDLTKSYGKVDFSALQIKPANWLGSDEEFKNMSLDLFKSLFENIFTDNKTYQAVHFVEKVTDQTKAPNFSDVTAVDSHAFTAQSDCFDAVPVTALRSKVLGCNSKFISQVEAAETDAAQEELIGKTINLIEGRGSSLPSVFKVVIVVQTIREAVSTKVTKIDSSGTSHEHDCTIGKFDATIDDKENDNKGSDLDSSIYFDEILSQSKMLVTVERIHYLETVGTEKVPRARLRVKQIEYLD